MAENRSLRVFISYARSDASVFAEELRCGLEVAGFDAFLDRHDIAAAEDWEARLGNLIQSADTVVFVLTPASVQSGRCQWEVDRAQALSKRIIPVVSMPVPSENVPRALSQLNFIFFTEGQFARPLGDLATALRVDLEWIREHTRLGEVATRWQTRNREDVLLLRGSDLAAARVWLARWRTPAPEPTASQREYIEASDRAENLLIKREKVRHQRSLISLASAAAAICLIVALAFSSQTSKARAEAANFQAELARRNGAAVVARFAYLDEMDRLNQEHVRLVRAITQIKTDKPFARLTAEQQAALTTDWTILARQELQRDIDQDNAILSRIEGQMPPPVPLPAPNVEDAN